MKECFKSIHFLNGMSNQSVSMKEWYKLTHLLNKESNQSVSEN